MVLDVWESRETFEKFSQKVVPILEDIGIDTGGLEVLETHNTIPG